MVTGLNIFRDYFADDTDKYVLIGGAACDIVFTSNAGGREGEIDIPGAFYQPSSGSHR